jgi:hypothetical protein
MHQIVKPLKQQNLVDQRLEILGLKLVSFCGKHVKMKASEIQVI